MNGLGDDPDDLEPIKPVPPDSEIVREDTSSIEPGDEELFDESNL